jgi:hypothetical protein
MRTTNKKDLKQIPFTDKKGFVGRPMMKLFIILCVTAFLYSVKSKTNSLFQFLVVKDSGGPSFRELYENYQKSLLEVAKKEGGEDVLVFHRRSKPSTSSSYHTKNDHKGGTPGSPKTVYFLKHNRLKALSDFKTFENLGFKVDDILEITENQFKTYEFISDPFPVYHVPAGDGIDTAIATEIFKSRYLQEILLSNITSIGDYINPTIVPFRGRLFLATGLAWGMHDSHNFNEHLEFRWLNNSLLPFSSFSSIYRTAASSNSDLSKNIPDPNPNDTYYEGINEQHISNLLQNQPIFGEDPRFVPISNEEAYIVFTNRFHNPLVMGIALFQYNKEKKQIEITRVKMVINPVVDAGAKNKNWSPFLLPSTKNTPSLSSHNSADSSHSADYLRHRPGDHSQNTSHIPHSHHPVEQTHGYSSSNRHRHLRARKLTASSGASPSAWKDMYLIQYVNPLTINKVKYSDLLDSSAMGSTDINSELVSQAPFLNHFHWPYGHLRGGTNAIYLSKQNIFLSFFHCVSDIHSFHYYLFGAYTFTASPPFRLLSYTPYPIMNEKLYTGPWMYLNKNRRIIYVVFPETIFLHTNEENGEEEVVLSFGYQDVSGYLGIINLNQLLLNLTPIEEES